MDHSNKLSETEHLGIMKNLSLSKHIIIYYLSVQTGK